MSNGQFYITTAIDYPNGAPHMGHAYEKIVTDFYARFYELMGADTYFLTGTDENGQKLKTSAEKAQLETMKYVDQNVEVFKRLCQDLGIRNDDFIRTTEARHKDTVHTIWKKLKDKDLIYQSEYTGHYCDDCESFYTETQLEDGNLCPHHHKELGLKTETGYFFKLSHFQDWLIKFHNDNPKFVIPSSSRKEIVSRLNDEVRDLSISRPNQGWGIEVPGDEKFVIYTWFDALINYYSALDEKHKKYWPASCHVIGRDIVWFHSVIWPAILNAADLEIPKHVYVHGMILAEDGKKMSKSLGNGVDPFEMTEKYGTENFRYYLLKSIPSHSNGRFSEEGLIQDINTSLANDYGNLIMRAVKLTLKRVGEELPYESFMKVDNNYTSLLSNIKIHIENFEHDKAIKELWSELQKVNQYINIKEPWTIKEPTNELKEIFFNCLYSIHCLTYLLYPAMPEMSKKILAIIGFDLNTNPIDGYDGLVYKLKEPEILFKKIQ
jgi:methionyl-tRNA synthetase